MRALDKKLIPQLISRSLTEIKISGEKVLFYAHKIVFNLISELVL